MNNNKVIYSHLKPCGEVFYIGIGEPNRPFSKVSRNKFWYNVVEKYGYEVQVLKTELSWSEAKDLEIELIAWYGRRDLGTGPLVNLTDGGEGILGYTHTEESRTKISYAMIGRSHSDGTKSMMSDSHKGKKRSKDQRDKMGKSKIGNTYGSKPIEQYTMNGSLINEFESASHAERVLNINRNGIGRNCKGTQSSFKGFIWKYKQTKIK